jgi:hypothetical protein
MAVIKHQVNDLLPFISKSLIAPSIANKKAKGQQAPKFSVCRNSPGKPITDRNLPQPRLGRKGRINHLN